MFKTPILFLVYNRLNYTKLSLKSILKIHPYKLYISCDGPKDKKLDFEKVNNVRNYVRNKSKHIAKVNFKFNKKNLGCKKSNLQAINWFFKNEKEGIILEDDCVARPEFYLYCKKLLKKFKDNKKIFCISTSSLHRASIILLVVLNGN